MIKLLIALLFPCSALALQGYDCVKQENAIQYFSDDGLSYVSIEKIGSISGLSTTKDYAQYLMDSYQGWQLRPVVSLQGFSFKFVENAPCVALLRFYDGSHYLFYKACGKISFDDLAAIMQDAKL